MNHIEFVVPKRPVSAQAKSRTNLQAWKALVAGYAARAWEGQPIHESGAVQMTAAYLCNESPVDVDNIIKPLQDALVGVVLRDDVLVTDVDSHRRSFDETFDLQRIPNVLLPYLSGTSEVVYIRVRQANALEEYLR
jgi:Holliday junction resolvase RusA-like endonuclease